MEPPTNPGRFIYATGAGMGLVMDELGVSWRQEVQDGQSLFERLEEIARDDSPPSVPNKS